MLSNEQPVQKWAGFFSSEQRDSMLITAYDYETTGVDPHTCEPVQMAAMVVTMNEDGTYTPVSETCEILKCNSEVPEGAYRVHGISTEMARSSTVYPHKYTAEHIRNSVLGYNNTNYDDHIAKRYGADITQSIDVFTAVNRLKAKGVLSKASLSAAYEHFTGAEAENAHDALADVQMTLALIPYLMEALEFKTFTEFVNYVSTPQGSLDTVWPFGKWKGKKVCNLPPSYVRWALENMRIANPDLRDSLEMYQEAKNERN